MAASRIAARRSAADMRVRRAEGEPDVPRRLKGALAAGPRMRLESRPWWTSRPRVCSTGSKVPRGTLACGCSKLHADGADLEELRTAVAEDTLFLLPAERMIGGATRYTRREIAEQTGLDLEFLAELRRAQGLPMAEEDARVLAETDLQAARTVRTLLDSGLRRGHPGGHPDPGARPVARRGGDAADDARPRLRSRRPTSTSRDALRPAAAEFEPLASPVLGQMLNAHLRHAVRTELLQVTEQATGELPGARDVAVASPTSWLHADGEEVPPGRARRRGRAPGAPPPTSWSCRCGWSRRSATR